MNTDLLVPQIKNIDFQVAENSTDLRLRSFALCADFTSFTLEVSTYNSGELVFNVLDLFCILGILVPVNHEIDLDSLLVYGFTENEVDALDVDSFFKFETVMKLCISEGKGLILLSALCDYLKSFGCDYFNKWYSKYLKQIKLLPGYSFYRKPGKVFLLDYDFRSENENLCGVTGDLYVIKFSTGVIKVGKSSSGPARIRQHSNEAGRYLVKIVDSYIKYGARLGENGLLDFCKDNGKLFYGNEYFKDLDFNKVKEFLIKIK